MTLKADGIFRATESLSIFEPTYLRFFIFMLRPPPHFFNKSKLICAVLAVVYFALQDLSL